MKAAIPKRQRPSEAKSDHRATHRHSEAQQPFELRGSRRGYRSMTTIFLLKAIAILAPLITLQVGLYRSHREDARMKDRLDRLNNELPLRENPRMGSPAESALLNPNCLYCKYFHGGCYNGVVMVCALHPIGKLDCPDFKAL